MSNVQAKLSVHSSMQKYSFTSSYPPGPCLCSCWGPALYQYCWQYLYLPLNQYTGFQLVPKLVTLNGQWPSFCLISHKTTAFEPTASNSLKLNPYCVAKGVWFLAAYG